MASNACGSEGFPAHVTNSISPQSHRTSRLWRCMASDHPLHPRPRLPRESLKDQADRQSQNRLILPSVIKPTTNQNDDFFDSIGHLRTCPANSIPSWASPPPEGIPTTNTIVPAI